MALRVLQTLEVLSGSLSQRGVIPDGLLDRGVDPAGLSVVVLVGA